MAIQLVVSHPQCSTESLRQQYLSQPVVLPLPSANSKPLTEEIPPNIALGNDIWKHLRNKPSLEQPQQQDSTGDMSMEDKSKKKKPDFTGKTTNVMLVQVPPAQAADFGGGWDFICSSQVAAHFWSKFAKSKHVLPLPIYDRNRLMTEQGYVVV